MNKKVLKLLIVPILVTAIFFLFQAFSLFTNFGVLSAVEEKPVSFEKAGLLGTPLLKNEKITGTFKASENNLGILLIKVIKFGKGSDTILFRIKKEGEEKWYYENKYWAEQFQNNQYFPFGFPLIANSKNNVYFFEIESQEGKYQNGIGVLKEKKTAAMYKYSIGQLKNYDVLLSFTSKKFAYAVKNINYWQVTAVFVVSFLLVLFMKKKKITISNIVRFLSSFNAPNFLSVFKKECIRVFKIIIKKIKSNYFSLEKKIINFSKKGAYWFTSTKFYLLFLNTNTKKRLSIGLLIFFLALTYRFSSSLVNQSNLFYYGLGGQGDYDQIIRAATCAVRDFCSYAILAQNQLFQTPILAVFYEIFGFTGALKVFLYLMIIFSSIVATLPYLLLSRKNWISIGGIIGSVFIATSDFLTKVALNNTSDNGSTFTFSMFYIVYLLTIHIGTIRWLLFFGLMGLVDGLNKALFLINDLVAFILFAPVFFYEKVREKGSSGFKVIFRKKSVKILLLSLLPLLVFLTIYSAWEYFVYVKWTAHYFLGELVVTRAGNYMAYTSLNDSSLAGGIISQLLYLSVSAIVMIKRLIAHTDLRIIFLAPIFSGMFILTFVKKKFPVKKFVLTFIFSIFIVILLALIKENYLKTHEIFAGEYIFYNWKTETYVSIYLFLTILFLFILNFEYSAIKLALPIIPYIIILIFLAKNSPFARLHTHVVVWSVILLAFIIDWIMMNVNKYSRRGIRIILGLVLLILFIYIYMFPKMATMITQLNSGIAKSQNEVRYLRWVEGELPANAVILAGGKSDLVRLGENIKRPIIYNSLYNAALLIKPKEIPGAKPTDFTIIPELKDKDNFRRNKYIILEDDIYVWRDRLTGVGDNVFSTSSATLLHADDYSIKVYKFNSTIKKSIYELKLK